MEFSVLGSFIALLLVNPLVLARTYDFWPCFFGVGGRLEPARVRARPRPAWAQPSLGPAQRPGTIFYKKFFVHHWGCHGSVPGFQQQNARGRFAETLDWGGSFWKVQ